MKKLLSVLVVLCFLTCLIWMVQLEMEGRTTEAPQLQTAETETAAPLWPTEPAEQTQTPAVFVPLPRTEPQQISLPVEFGDENFLQNMLIAVEEVSVPNNEMQVYDPAQVKIEGNQVFMTAEEREGQYYSGKAVSAFSFRYGTIRFRISTMDNTGLFPAVWLLPADGSMFPEVDILEIIGRKPDELFGVLHFPVEGEKNKEYSTQYFMYPYPFPNNLPDSYTVTFEWNEDSLVWYVGDLKVQTFTLNIPDEPMYLIMNLAVGGNWSGPPDGSSVFPTTLQVEILDFQPREIYTR